MTRDMKYSLRQFNRKFGKNEDCLEAIKLLRFPNGVFCNKCQKITNHYQVSGRTSYACAFCGVHMYPLAGTIFQKSTTPLTSWFFAMYLMTQTRSGMSAKQLERMLGVTYKCAWRMFKQIRLLMSQSDGIMLSGVVEIDESYFGGKIKRKDQWGGGIEKKQIVMGMVERGGKAYLKHIPDTSKYTLINQIQHNVDPKARVMTDQFQSYKTLSKLGYTHDIINHQRAYAVGDIYTQNIENIWSHLKRGIYGVYRHVSKKYLQAYVDEYTWRYNNRKHEGLMFNRLLEEVVNVRLFSVGKTV